MSAFSPKSTRSVFKRQISASAANPPEGLGEGEIAARKGLCTKMQLGSVGGRPMIRNSKAAEAPRTRICNRELPSQLPADGWFHIAPFGEYRSVRIEGDTEVPAIQVCDMESFTRQKAYFDQLKAKPGFRGQRFDYDHLSWAPGGTTETSAYCMDMDIRGTGENTDDGLYVKLELTPTASQKVKAREYCYLSQEAIVEDLPSDAQGMPRIRAIEPTGGALTNKPALPVRAMNRENQLSPGSAPGEPRNNMAEEAATKKENNTMKTIAVALGLPEDATESDILSKIKSLTADAKQLPEVQNALKKLADAELDRNATAFADKHKARITNREGAIAAYKKDPAAADTWAATFAHVAAEAKPRLLNRDKAKEPNLKAEEGGQGAVAKVRNRARQIQREQGTSWAVAFRAAQDEIEQK